MSATIYWKPDEPAKGTVGTFTPSAFIEALREAFGESNSSWILSEDDLPVLTGMAAAWKDGPKTENPFRFLIRKIENDGEPRSIKVWAAW